MVRRQVVLLWFAASAAALVVPGMRSPARGAFPRRLVAVSAGDLATQLLDAEPSALEALLADNFDALDAPTMAALEAASKDETKRGATQRVGEAIEAETERRMLQAKEKLEYILDAGELLEMDRRLVSLFKQGGVDVPFMLCLNANAVNSEEASDKRMCLDHLYTRAQEELEKKVDPAAGVLHKLCRQPDADIRGNILMTYLAPQTELIAPDATRIPLPEPIPPKIGHDQFAAAVADAVTQLRGLDADGDLIRANIEMVRQIAIEARLVLVETGNPEYVAAFEEELSKTWPMGSAD